MNFELDDEQTMLRDTTRELLNRSYDAEKRNATSATDEGWNASVWKQFAELGLLGLLAREGAMEGIDAAPVVALEYWSLRPDRRADGAGRISNSYGPRSTLKTAEAAIDHAADTLTRLAHDYLLGDAPFVPGEGGGYGDYDQLMRRDEWFGRGEDGL